MRHMWTGKSVSVKANGDELTFTLVYEVTDGVNVEQITEPRVSSVDSIDQIISDAVAYRNRVEAQKAAIAALDPALYADVTLEELKDRKKPPPPTQEELDRQAWLALKTDYQIKLKALGISKTITQTDVDDAYAAMKAAFKEEYGVFL